MQCSVDEIKMKEAYRSIAYQKGVKYVHNLLYFAVEKYFQLLFVNVKIYMLLSIIK